MINIEPTCKIKRYNYNNINNAYNIDNYNSETDITKEVYRAGIKDTSITEQVNETNNDKRILIITWNEEAPVIDKLSDEYINHWKMIMIQEHLRI